MVDFTTIFTKDIFALDPGGCNEYSVIAPVCHGLFAWSGLTFGALSNISRFEQNMFMLITCYGLLFPHFYSQVISLFLICFDEFK